MLPIPPIPKVTDMISCLIYLAPEIMLGQESTTKSDSYSFGLLLFELLTKEAPYRCYATLVDIIQGMY